MSRIKVTLTLDQNLVGQLDQFSKARKQKRSRLVEEAIRQWYQSQLEQELIAGYCAMAKEDKKMAEENLPIAREILDD
jgi:metal-responsive CopG/Arc/MetJ family transcriptional regulator